MSAVRTDFTALQREDFEIPKIVARSRFNIPHLSFRRKIPSDILVPRFCVFRISVEIKEWRSSKFFFSDASQCNIISVAHA
uniref:Uncharacterized protein n=1 Tax=Magallana gigas TaxID=29159 RepID=K1REL0_MAGGI